MAVELIGTSAIKALKKNIDTSDVKVFCISEKPFGEDYNASIAAMESLEELIMINICMYRMPDLKRLSSLKKLVVSDNCIDVLSDTGIEDIKTLEVLEVDNNPITASKEEMDWLWQSLPDCYINFGHYRCTQMLISAVVAMCNEYYLGQGGEGKAVEFAYPLAPREYTNFVYFFGKKEAQQVVYNTTIEYGQDNGISMPY